MQPVASLIAAGHIDVENRSWITQFRGHFLIHASNKIDFQAIEWLKRLGMVIPPPNQMLRGGIVGVACMHDCVRSFESHSDFATGERWTFEFSERITLPFVLCRGKTFFFDVDNQVVDELLKRGAKLPKINQSQRNKRQSA
jgi:hypothetical protein